MQTQPKATSALWCVRGHQVLCYAHKVHDTDYLPFEGKRDLNVKQTAIFQ